MRETLKKRISDMTKGKAVAQLYLKSKNVVDGILLGGGRRYVWGTGHLGRFAYTQLQKNQIEVSGYIDNNQNNLDDYNKIYPPYILHSEDVVIIATFFYVEVKEQLEKMGIRNYIYYEDLALSTGKFDIYYQAFKGIFDEIESNKEKYMQLYDILSDNLSCQVYSDIMNYRMSMDVQFTIKAMEKSLVEGEQYFDRIIIEKLQKNTEFFDVGGYDGESTLSFIKYALQYKKIYFFEPDAGIFEESKKRLRCIENITYIMAGAGEDRGIVHYNALGGGGGMIEADGAEIIPTIALDEYISGSNAYVKMDVEGYELSALRGMKNSIMKYKPMLAVSVYHKPGDIHMLISTILSWNPSYKVYMRHYTPVYADTVCYFL